MDAGLVLVTGGCRSGKSAFAQTYVEDRVSGPKTYIATCPILDQEMDERIARHRQEREGRNWTTLEEETALANVVTSAPSGPLLIDCLTLWICNCQYHAERGGTQLHEDDATQLACEAAAACRARDGLSVVVTNEVGLGIVPDNAEARLFRDLAGRVNQAFASAADEVYLLVSGLPVRIK